MRKEQQINQEHVGPERRAMNRRRFMGYFSAGFAGATLMPGALAAVAQDAKEITPEMIEAAANIAGLTFNEEEIKRMVKGLNGLIGRYEGIRELAMGNSTQPAIVFNPVPAGMKLPTERKPFKMSSVSVKKPSSEAELAFMSVRELAELVRTRQITSTELTKLYLKRLKKYDPTLFCVVSMTEELALKQAKQADEEIAAGKYRGPLHGLPWGAKDLFAVKGYKTTWGASPYKDQVIDVDSTVFTKLTEAGAVLAAKLAMGALAMGDRWYRERTRCPWNPEQGSSGSSAGPGSATAGGLVGFGSGAETQGSIISPSRRNGVTGLRPTFGRVSRYGAMALSWTMDKIGPMCRCAEDCAIVFNAIYGPDLKDNSVLDVPFNWDATAEVSKLRVGYLREPSNDVLEVIGSLGIRPKEVKLPEMPTRNIGFILSTESAAAFDDLFRSGKDNSMREQPERSNWPNTFRQYRFVPAVEYIQANRARTRLIEEFNKFFEEQEIDMFLGSSLSLTNLTGNPEVSIPYEFNDEGMPNSVQITGRLFGEAEILLLAHAIQGKTDHHLKHPKM